MNVYRYQFICKYSHNGVVKITWNVAAGCRLLPMPLPVFQAMEFHCRVKWFLIVNDLSCCELATPISSRQDKISYLISLSLSLSLSLLLPLFPQTLVVSALGFMTDEGIVDSPTDLQFFPYRHNSYTQSVIFPTKEFLYGTFPTQKNQYPAYFLKNNQHPS